MLFRSWRRVQVHTAEGTRRPLAICLERRWQELSVLGRYQEPAFRPGEVGYRVRLYDGHELNLVREPLGIWYLDLVS